MPIRIAPFESIDATLIESLKDRGVREDRTLDFKRELNLGSETERAEFLKDVTAFANGSGGVLLYGVEETRGANAGSIAGYPALTLDNPAATHELIDDLLRHGVDERLMGVLHRAVPRPDQRHYYVVRVAPSPLAPHMVSVGRHKSKFFLRSNTTIDTMDARQIKESALRAASALERASAIAEERQRFLEAEVARPPEEGGRREHPTDDLSQLMVHIVPLFPARGGFALAEERVADRLSEVPVLGWRPSDRQYTLDGLVVRGSGPARSIYLRSGAVEMVQWEWRLPWPVGGTAVPIPGWEIEQAVLQALDACAGRTADGLLPLPAVVSVALSGVLDTALEASPHRAAASVMRQTRDVVRLTPLLISAWDAAASHDIRSAFHEMYQAWGFARSPNATGHTREWWNERGQTKTPKPRHWAAGWEAPGED